jgi:PAS domain S-box-containing protein
MGEAREHEQERGATEPDEPISRGDREVLDTIARAMSLSPSGFDDAVLGAIADALRGRVAFDRISVAVDDEDGRSFRLFWRSGATDRLKPIFPSGARVALDRNLEGLPGTAGNPARPVIVQNVGARGTPLDRTLFEGGVRSFVGVPLEGRPGERAWLSLSHADYGAPFEEALPLLLRVADALRPAISRARALQRTKLLATLVEASPDGMLALDDSYVTREANQAALRILAKGRSQVVGAALVDVIGAQAAKLVVDALALRPHAAAVSLVVPVARGEPRPIDATVGVVEGSIEASYHVHLRDARERRAAEAAMGRRLEHLSVLRALGEALGSDLRVQTAIERALDVCSARMPTGGMAALRAEDGDMLRAVASRGVAASGDSSSLSRALAWIRRDQLEALDVPRRWKLVLPLSHARRTWGALFVVGREDEPLSDAAHDLWDSIAATVSSALHAAEDFEHVVELEAERRLLVDTLPVIVARVEPARGWSTSFVNGAVERILGVAPPELHGLPGFDGTLDPLDRASARDARRRAGLGEKVGWENRRYCHKDGHTLTLREYVYPVHDVDGTVRSVQLIAYDVTTEIESRQRLIQADRLASLGALAAGIAHEINNPVAFIGLAAGQIPRLTDPERVQQLSREIGEAASRIAHIVGELKLFTRIPDGAAVTPVDVNRMLQTAVTLTSAEIRKRARLDVSLGDLPLAPGRSSGLGQAFVNLLLNGAQSVENTSPGRARVVSVASSSQGNCITIEFSDSGPGIAAEHLPRIFDPFFSAAPEGNGGGLGLAIAYDLVRRAGGDIKVTSSPGQGTKFEIVLALDAPASVEEPHPAPRLITFEKPVSVPPPAPDAQRSRVLIIDDELALAKALARQLAARYEVDTASTAADALAQLSVYAYDAIVCDLRMPDQSGPAIHDAVRARSSASADRFIFTTGGSYGTSDDEIHERARATGRPILEKPFDGASFEALVEQVAGGER